MYMFMYFLVKSSSKKKGYIGVSEVPGMHYLKGLCEKSVLIFFLNGLRNIKSLTHIYLLLYSIIQRNRTSQRKTRDIYCNSDWKSQENIEITIIHTKRFSNVKHARNTLVSRHTHPQHETIFIKIYSHGNIKCIHVYIYTHISLFLHPYLFISIKVVKRYWVMPSYRAPSVVSSVSLLVVEMWVHFP